MLFFVLRGRTNNNGDLLWDGILVISTKNSTQSMDSAAQSLADGASALRMRRLLIAFLIKMQRNKRKTSNTTTPSKSWMLFVISAAETKTTLVICSGITFARLSLEIQHKQWTVLYNRSPTALQHSGCVGYWFFVLFRTNRNTQK